MCLGSPFPASWLTCPVTLLIFWGDGLNRTRLCLVGVNRQTLVFSELYYDRGNHFEFSSVVRELDTAGALVGNRVSLCPTAGIQRQVLYFEFVQLPVRWLLERREFSTVISQGP